MSAAEKFFEDDAKQCLNKQRAYAEMIPSHPIKARYERILIIPSAGKSGDVMFLIDNDLLADDAIVVGINNSAGFHGQSKEKIDKYIKEPLVNLIATRGLHCPILFVGGSQADIRYSLDWNFAPTLPQLLNAGNKANCVKFDGMFVDGQFAPSLYLMYWLRALNCIETNGVISITCNTHSWRAPNPHSRISPYYMPFQSLHAAMNELNVHDSEAWDNSYRQLDSLLDNHKSYISELFPGWSEDQVFELKCDKVVDLFQLLRAGLAHLNPKPIRAMMYRQNCSSQSMFVVTFQIDAETTPAIFFDFRDRLILNMGGSIR